MQIYFAGAELSISNYPTIKIVWFIFISINILLTYTSWQEVKKEGFFVSMGFGSLSAFTLSFTVWIDYSYVEAKIAFFIVATIVLIAPMILLKKADTLKPQ